MSAVLVGPKKGAALWAVRQKLVDGCMECDCCGGPWHFKAARHPGASVQVHVGDRVMAVKRAAWYAFFDGRSIKKGHRITSSCPNPHCINPDLLFQATPGAILKATYEHGIRLKTEDAMRLVGYTRSRQKLTDDDVRAIRASDKKGKAAAHEWGISPEHYNSIQRGHARAGRAHNPFAGLGAR